MSFLFFAATLAAQTLPAPENPRWLRVGGNGQGEYSIDPASISRRDNRVRVLVRLRLSEPGSGGLRTGIMRYDYDCRANTVRSEVVDMYTDQGFHSTYVTPEDRLSDESFASDSPNAQVIGHLCAGR